MTTNDNTPTETSDVFGPMEGDVWAGEIVIAGPVTVYANESHRQEVHAEDVARSAKQAAWHFLTERSDVEPEREDMFDWALQLLADAEQRIRRQMRKPEPVTCSCSEDLPF